MNKKNIKWVILILLLPLLLELSVGIYRGYGLLNTSYYSKMPLGYVVKDFSDIKTYLKKYYSTSPKKMPSPTDFDKNIESIFMAEQQPYSDYDIWVFKSKRKKGHKYLYSPLSLLLNDHESNQCPVNVESYNIITFCILGFYDEKTKEYRPNLLPEFYQKTLGSAEWFCYTIGGITYFSEFDKPPIPQSYVLENDSGKQSIYYPEHVLDILKAIYPKYELKRRDK